MTIEPVLRPIDAAPNALLALHSLHPARYPVLFESAPAGPELGRFDILFAFPQESMTLLRDGVLIGKDGASVSASFLDGLDRWWRELRQAPIESPVPFVGGWFVYLGYELAGQVEPRLKLREPAAGPVAMACRIPAAIIMERASMRAWIVAEAESAALVDAIATDLASAAAIPAKAQLIDGAIHEDPPEEYLHAVTRALQYIAGGDIYQANLSRRWRARLSEGVQPHDVYRRLRRTNPGPFNALAVMRDLAIVSSSPERLVQARKGWISTRPIAGTRPRGRNELADRELVYELHAHPKERAEHIMLIDLERNDLGRVCEAGSVEVDEYMTIETYAHVHHIVSNVRGRLRPDVAPGEALAAVFPGGTITGCPKVRCMEIIAELEDNARGAYTGSLGYLNRDGSMDFNILIRSLEIHGREITLRAGAGIVADSIPERELEESRAKARGVLQALSGEGG